MLVSGANQAPFVPALGESLRASSQHGQRVLRLTASDTHIHTTVPVSIKALIMPHMPTISDPLDSDSGHHKGRHP